MRYLKLMAMGLMCVWVGIGAGWRATAAPVAGQITPVAVYHDLDHPFGLAYDSVHNLMWYTRGDSGDSLVHSLRPYRTFSLAEKLALPDIGGEKQLSPADSQNDVAGTTAVAGAGAHFTSLAFDSTTGQLVAQNGSGALLKSFDPFTGANLNLNYKPGSATENFSDGLDVEGTNVWYSPDIGPIYLNGVLFASNGDPSKTFLPGWTGLGGTTGLGWSGCEQVANSLIAVAVHSGSDIGRSRTLVRFDATTGELLGYDPDGDSRAARWEDLAFDGRYLYAADLRGDANGNGIRGDIYVFDVTGGLEPIPCRIKCPSDFDVDGDAGGALVLYAPPQMTGDCSNAVVRCMPPSGTVFPAGKSTVACELVDAANLTNTCSFTVNVLQEKSINLSKNNLLQGGSVKVGDVFRYEISFDTYSITDSAVGLRLLDPLPVELDFISMTTNGALSAIYNPLSRTAVWDFGTWPPLSAGPTNFLEVRINTNAVLGETIDNVAVLLSSNLPPRSGQDKRPGCPACPPGVLLGSNSPPVAVCQSITVSNDLGTCSATVTPDHVGGGSYDPKGTAVALTLTPPGPYAVGSNAVTLTVTDTNGLSASCAATITVVDAEPPAITCPANIIVDFTGATGTVVAFSASAMDQCPGPVGIVYAPPPGTTFPIGTNTVAVVATDAAGNSNSCSFQVTVLGARGVNKECLAALTALRGSVTDKHEGEELDDAIAHLTASLDPSLWLDETHLQRLHGETVFQQGKHAVQDLVELLKDEDGVVPPAVLQQLIDCILRVDRLLAVVAIDEATVAGVNPAKIDGARKQLAEGDLDASQDQFAQAVDGYRNAWDRVKHAKIDKLHQMASGGVQLQILGFAGESYVIQTSSNLTDWVTLGTWVAGPDGVVVAEEANAPSGPRRFYRLVAP